MRDPTVVQHEPINISVDVMPFLLHEDENEIIPYAPARMPNNSVTISLTLPISSCISDLVLSRTVLIMWSSSLALSMSAIISSLKLETSSFILLTLFMRVHSSVAISLRPDIWLVSRYSRTCGGHRSPNEQSPMIIHRGITRQAVKKRKMLWTMNSIERTPWSSKSSSNKYMTFFHSSPAVSSSVD